MLAADVERTPLVCTNIVTVRGFLRLQIQFNSRAPPLTVGEKSETD